MTEDSLTLTESSRAHLELIRQVVLLAQPDCELWLRAGWAVDFFVGRVTREHTDVDFFALCESADRLTERLLAHGYEIVNGPPSAQQRNFARNGIDLQFGLIDRDEETGDAIVAGGPWAGERWPAGMLEGRSCTLHGVTSRVISAAAQIEIKEMMPVWVSGRPVRAKDQRDIEKLRVRLREMECDEGVGDRKA